MANSPFPQLPDHFEDDVLQVCKLLADATRLRIVVLLARDGEHDVTTLCDRLGHSQPAVSHHLALLRLGGLIRMRRDGKRNFYTVVTPRFIKLIDAVMQNVDGENKELRFAKYVLSYDEPQEP